MKKIQSQETAGIELAERIDIEIQKMRETDRIIDEVRRESKIHLINTCCEHIMS